jgi:hypothetical protein
VIEMLGHQVGSGPKPRKPKEHIHGVYLPRMREAYGPRWSSGWTLDAFMEQRSYGKIQAKHLRHSSLTCVEQSMPKGGRRWRVECPGCHQLRTALYVDGLAGLRCRECLNFRYASQYGYRQRRVNVAARELAWLRRRHEAESEVSLKAMRLISRTVLDVLMIYRAMLASAQREDATEERAGLIVELTTITAKARQAQQQAWALMKHYKTAA